MLTIVPYGLLFYLPIEAAIAAMDHMKRHPVLGPGASKLPLDIGSRSTTTRKSERLILSYYDHANRKESSSILPAPAVQEFFQGLVT